MLQKSTSSDIMSCCSATSILSQQSSQPSPSSLSSPSIEPTTIRTQPSDSAIFAEKNECDQLLNIAMTTLHQKFGQNGDPKIMSIIHKKLNELKQIVSGIETQAKQKHIDIDKKLDEAHRFLKFETKKQHQHLEQHKEAELMNIYNQFEQYVDNVGHNNNNNNNHNVQSAPQQHINTNNNNINNNNHNVQSSQQHHPSQLVINRISSNHIIQQNQNQNLIIITNGNNAVVKAFIIQQQQNQNQHQQQQQQHQQHGNSMNNNNSIQIQRPSNIPQLE